MAKKKKAKKRAVPGKPHSPKTRVTQLQKKVAERALQTTEYEIQVYVPCEADIAIAEAMLSGNCSREEIERTTGLPTDVVNDCLKAPVACAWISRRVHENIAHRLGLVDAAMMQRAVRGDVAAARLILDRYGQMTSKSMHLSISAEASEVANLTDEDLDALLKTAQKPEPKVIEAKPAEEDV